MIPPLCIKSQFQKIQNKIDGESSTVHEEPISEANIAKLEYFSDVLVVKLSQFCWCNVTNCFALRGGKLQVQLKKSDIVFEVDRNGNEYATLKRDFITENAQGGLKGKEFVTEATYMTRPKKPSGY